MTQPTVSSSTSTSIYWHSCGPKAEQLDKALKEECVRRGSVYSTTQTENCVL